MFFRSRTPPQHILINRVDAMGDVILALPVCGLIKKYFPGCRITFLGRTYTQSVAACCIHIDDFINRDDWNVLNDEQVSAMLQAKRFDTVIHLLPAKDVIIKCWKAKIKLRIGGRNKLHYLLYCNRIISFSRKKARLSEAQLNIKLLKGINIPERPLRNEVAQYYGFSNIPSLDAENTKMIDPEKINLILHPLSNKNAQEWGLHNFSSLIKMIDSNKYKIFITGSVNEKEILSGWIEMQGNAVTDLTGILNTAQLIAFISACDGLIASSTGPVHIAAASGINCLGLYENKWTKRGERWGPIGKNAAYLECVDDDMNTISPGMAFEKIKEWKKPVKLEPFKHD